MLADAAPVICSQVVQVSELLQPLSCRPASEYGPGGVKLVNGKPCPEDESAKKKCIGEDGKEITPEWAQEEEVSDAAEPTRPRVQLACVPC